MGEDGNFLYLSIAPQILKQCLQCISSVVGAFPIISIGKSAATRRPCDQDGNAIGSSIVGNLRKSKDRVLEPVVEAVDKDKDAAIGALPDGGAKPVLGRFHRKLLAL